MTNAASKLTLYLDTTIPNYVFAQDTPERMELTKQFMRFGRHEYEMVISDVVTGEINKAPEPKRSLLLEVIKGLPILDSSPESYDLADAYIRAGALPRSSIDDARHVALATLHKVDALISWNFGHLVNIRRAKAIKEINAGKGLHHLEILSPEEVIFS